MNSMNFERPVSGTTSPQWERENAAKPAALADLRPASALVGVTGGRRVLVGALVTGIQVLLVMGLGYGLAHNAVVKEVIPLLVTIIPEEEQKIDQPPLPPPPVMEQPQVVINLPPTPQIYQPPPPIPAAPSERALTTTSAPVVPPPPDTAVVDFQVKLLRHLNRHKRYPAQARAKREQGTVMVRFIMDRSGKVVHAVLEKACNFPALNEEGVALLSRAQPLPIPPPQLEGDRIEMIVPVEFSLR